MISIHARSFTIFFLSMFLNACETRLPRQSAELKTAELVEVTDMDSTIRLDIRYATTDNFTGIKLYDHPKAFLQKDAAVALVKAQAQLKEKGYGLIVFDGYRPWSVTRKFWDVTAPEHRKFVADPKQGSRHNRGCAVDVTLYDIVSGKVVEMTGNYDEWSERSYPYYEGGTVSQKALRDLLRTTMEQNGFSVYEFEWWHFDYKDWKDYRIMNTPFDQIVSGKPKI